MSGEREWRDVVGWGGMYVGVYQVSDDGFVKRVKTGRILKPAPNSGNGYLGVSLCADGKKSTRKVHRLVAQAFIENPENKGEIDHIDRNKFHNHVSNLRWVTHSENNTNKAGRSNTGIRHICKSRSNGYPVFYVQIKRGRKRVVGKYFYIGDRDEAEVLAEAEAYLRERCSELGIQLDDREAAGGADRDADGGTGTGTGTDAGARTDGCAHLQPILEYIRDNVIRMDGDRDGC
jgi:hypothetical protein